jgi:hypothetical protein
VGRRPVATYSIVARDPETGELGVAVQSHWFSVGPIVASCAWGARHHGRSRPCSPVTRPARSDRWR